MSDCKVPPPEETDPTGEAADERLAAVCRALGHPARVRIVRLLVEKQACFAGEIADELPLAASTVSQHLDQLKRAGVIVGDIEGPRRSYCVDPAVVEQVRRLLQNLLAS